MAEPSDKLEKADEQQPESATDPTEEFEGLESEFEEVLGELLPPEQRREVAEIVAHYVITRFEGFSGPLPHPKHLRQYEDISPGITERLLTMTEDTMKHNRSIGQQMFDADKDDRRLGHFFGFASLMCLIIAAVYTGVNGHDWLAAGFLSTGALGVVAIFIRGRRDGE